MSACWQPPHIKSYQLPTTMPVETGPFKSTATTAHHHPHHHHQHTSNTAYPTQPCMQAINKRIQPSLYMQASCKTFLYLVVVQYICSPSKCRRRDAKNGFWHLGVPENVPLGVAQPTGGKGKMHALATAGRATAGLPHAMVHTRQPAGAHLSTHPRYHAHESRCNRCEGGKSCNMHAMRRPWLNN